MGIIHEPLSNLAFNCFVEIRQIAFNCECKNGVNHTNMSYFFIIIFGCYCPSYQETLSSHSCCATTRDARFCAHSILNSKSNNMSKWILVFLLIFCIVAIYRKTYYSFILSTATVCVNTEGPGFPGGYPALQDYFNFLL